MLVSVTCSRPAASDPDPSLAVARPSPTSPSITSLSMQAVDAEPGPSPHRDVAPTSREKVYVAPLGAEGLEPNEVNYVRDALLAFFDVDVVVLPAHALPHSAYYPPRKRYRAEKLLPFLESIRPQDGARLLGLTSVDISTTKGPHRDWGVLGLANIDGTVCVLSTFRTHKKSRNREHARVRLGKTAVHEVGHTLGLEHCPNAGCLMQDARGTVLTTDHEYDLCADCRGRLSRRGMLRDEPAPPWSRP